MKTSLFSVFLLFFVNFTYAQSPFPLQIQVNVLPPYSAYLQDYPGAGQRVRVLLINTSTQTYQVRLTGQLTGDNGVEVRTSPNYRPQRPLTVPPGQTLLSRTDLEGLFDLNQIEVTGIDKNVLARGLPLPDGMYQLCVRAYNETASRTGGATFGQPLSPEFPLGCSAPIIVRAVEPPILISPRCDAEVTATVPQAIVFTWTPPAGVSPAQVDYTLRIVELPQMNVDPNVYVDAVALPRSGVEVRNLRTSTFLYGPTQPPLQVGKRYAWRVQAIDRSGRLNFLNNGKAPVCSFTYGTGPVLELANKPGFELAQTPIVPIPGLTSLPATPSVDSAGVEKPMVMKNNKICKSVALPTNNSPQSGPLNGKTVTLGEFDLTIATATFQNGSYTGEGRVTWNGAPIKVAFTGLKVNGQNQVFDGVVNSSGKGPGMPTIPLGQIDGYGALPNNYFDQIKTTLLDAAKQAVAIPLPLKYDGKLGTVGINHMSFSPVGAEMDLVVGVSLPEANLNLFLAAVNVCTSPQKKLPDTGTLYLVKDLPMPIPGGIGQKFVFKKSDPNKAKPDGTYATIINGDFDNVHGMLALNLGSSILKADDGKGAIKAGDLVGTITADFVQWADWVGTVSLPPFQVPGLSGVTFTGTDVVYDHSDKANPAGFNLPQDYTGDKGPTFHGTYFNKLTVELPSSFKSTPRIGIAVNGGIIDELGFTGLIAAANTPILDYTKGSLAGFGFGIDDIQWTIVQNSNRGGNMVGQLQFPISTGTFSYSCSLSGGFTDMQFTTVPKAGYQVPLFAANMDLNANTAISVTYKAGQSTKVSMSLGGVVSIDVKKVAGSGAVGKTLDSTIPKLYFEQFTVANTKTPGATAIGGSGLYLNTGTWSLTNDIAQAAKPGSTPKSSGSGPSADDEQPDDWAMTLEEDSKPSLGGFPLDFAPPTMVTTAEGAGLRLGIGLHLGEAADDNQFVQAHGTLDILGTITTENGRFKPVYNGIYPRSLSIAGGIGPLTVNGGLDFITSNPTYGDGVKGNATVQIPGFDVKVKMMMLFGNVKGFNYGFLDGSVQFPVGVPIVGPIVLTGLGGGMHYNMGMAVNGKDALKNPDSVTALAKSTVDNNSPLPAVDLAQPGKTMSGAVFSPAKGNWGLTAKIYAGLADPKVFNSSLAMTVSFAGGGMGGINLHGNANVISTSGDGDGKDGMVHADMDITYDFQQKELDASLGVDASYPGITAHVPFTMHVASASDWFVKLGDPQNVDNRINASLLNIDQTVFSAHLSVNGYLAAGVGPNLGGLPPLPKDVINFMGKPQTRYADQVKLANRSLPNIAPTNTPGAKAPDFALLFGGGVTGKLRVQVMPFRLWAKAEAGFDAGLFKDQDCSDGTKPTGLKGWYGKGQVYTYLGGGVDLFVDVWFFEGSVSLMTLEAGAVLTGGFIDPSWADGTVKVSGSVLDGLIKVSTEQQFSFGQKCEPVYGGDPLKDIDIIADITPATGATDISCKPTVAVAFNVPMNQEFVIHLPAGENRKYTFITAQPVFRYKPKNAAQKPVTDLNPLVWSADGQSYVLATSAFLPSYATCTLSQKVVIKEIGPGGKLDDPYNDAKKIREPRSQERTVSFTLGKQPDDIPLETITATWPVMGQQYFLKKQEPKGFIKGTYKGLAFLDDVTNPAYEYNANFSTQNGLVASTPIQYNGQGLITFAIPEKLANQQAYALDIVKRDKPKTGGSGNALTSAKYMSLGQAQVRKTSLNVNAVNAFVSTSAANQGKKLFSMGFKTSQYNFFVEKMKGLQLKATDYLGGYTIEFRTAPGKGYEPFDSFDFAGEVLVGPGILVSTPKLTVTAPNTETPNTPFEQTMKTRIYDVMKEFGEGNAYDIVDNYNYQGQNLDEEGYPDQGNYKYMGSDAVAIEPMLNQDYVYGAEWRETIPISTQGWWTALRARPLKDAVYCSYNGPDMIRFKYMRDNIMLGDMGALVEFMRQMRIGNVEALKASYAEASKNPDWYKLPKGMTEAQFIDQYRHKASPGIGSYGYTLYAQSTTMALRGKLDQKTYISNNWWKITEDAFYSTSQYDYGNVPQRGQKDPMYVAFSYEMADASLMKKQVYYTNFLIGEINKASPPVVPGLLNPKPFYYVPLSSN